MRIEIGDRYALDRYDAGFVLERKIPEHVATKTTKYAEKGDLIPERWKVMCYPHNVEHASRYICEDVLKNDRGISREVSSFNAMFQETILALASAIRPVTGDREQRA